MMDVIPNLALNSAVVVIQPCKVSNSMDYGQRYFTCQGQQAHCRLRISWPRSGFLRDQRGLRSTLDGGVIHDTDKSSQLTFAGIDTMF